MKKMKITKTLAILALASTALIFAGCGKKPVTTTKKQDDSLKVDGFTFKVFNGEAEIVSIDPKGSVLEIPETLNGNKVTRMSYTYTDDELTKVVIPESLTHLTGNGFMNCKNLTEVQFSGTPTISDIPSKAFAGTKLTSITIPASVKSISYEAFKDVDTLTSVTFASGSTLDTIGPFAFYDCDSISTINLPSNLKIISDSAFEKCDHLSSVSFANTANLETIDQFAFANCTSVTTLDLSASTSLTKIGANAFRGCDGLTSVTFDDALREIGDKAFYDTKNITNVVLPSSITTIGDEVFVNAGLTSMEVKFGGDTTIGNNAFSQYDVYGETLVPRQQITTLKVDGSLTLSKLFTAYAPYVRQSLETLNVTGTNIASEAFMDCTSLNSLTIATGVTRIGASAFEGCTSITAVTLNSGLTEIAANTFKGCTDLENVTLPTTVRAVRANAFDGCVKIANLDLSNLTEIGDYAFRNTLIATPTFSATIATIGAYAFFGCTEITAVELNTNAGVTTTIKQYAFADCPNIETIKITSGTFMESNVFANDTNVAVLHTRGEYGLDSLFGEGKAEVAKKIVEVEILDGTTEIEAGAFAGCLSVSLISLPPSVAKIGDEAFKGCRGITSINLNELPNLTSIGKYAFANCDKLHIESLPASITKISEGLFQNDTSITFFTINDGVESIGASAFDGCANLELGGLNDSITYIGSKAFKGCLKLELQTLPENIKEIGSYAFEGCLLVTINKTPDSLEKIDEYAFKGCQSIASFEFVNDLAADEKLGNGILEGCTKIHELKIFGSTSLEKLFGESVSALKPVLTTVTINEGSEELVEEMFMGFTALSVVDLSACDIKKIGKSAFDGCESLTSIDISKVDEIGDSAFARSGLASITIPANGIILGEYMFEDCKSLSKVIFAKNSENPELEIKEIPAGTFKGTILIDVELPNTVTKIGAFAFNEIFTLNSFAIGDESELTSIGESAFDRCFNIYEFFIPKGVTEIGESAFNTCIALKYVTFDSENRITAIPDLAFNTCYALTRINLPDTIKSIGEGAFENCRCLTYVDADEEEDSIFALPYNLDTIGESAFAGATSLNRVAIPLKVEKIPNGAFANCYMLEVVIWNENIKTIGDEAFMNTPYSTAIPLTVSSIGKNAFACEDIQKYPVTFAGVDLVLGPENGVGLTIGDEAFMSSGLKSVTFGPKVSAMGVSVFSKSSVESVNFEALIITLINKRMFEECASLTTVVMGQNKSINTIGEAAFKLTPITSFVFTNIVSIGDEAFAECAGLGVQLELGNGGKGVTIGNKAFNKSGITKLTLGANIVSIGSQAFSECGELLTADFEALNITAISEMFFSKCSKLKTVTINNNIRTIGTNAFEGTAIISTEFLSDAENLERIMDKAFTQCTALKTVIIPNSVTYVGLGAFSDCNAVTSVTWSENCNVINDETFNGCSGITEFTVLENITHIGKFAFIAQGGTTLTFLTDTPPSADEQFLANKGQGFTIIVPKNAKDTYLKNYSFSLYESIIQEAE